MGLSPLLLRDPGFKSQSEFWPGLELHLRKTAVFGLQMVFVRDFEKHRANVYRLEVPLQAKVYCLKWNKTGRRV